MLTLIAILLLSQSSTKPPDFTALSRDAAAARDAGRLNDAYALYAKALKIRPDWDEGLWNAGSIAYDADRYSDCAQLFRRLAVVKPDLAPAWTMLGLCEYGLRDYDSARKSLLQAERLHFDGPAELSRAARLHLAIVLTKAGSFEKALVLLTELTRMDRKTQDITIAAGIAGLRKPWLPSEVPESEREKVAMVGDAMSTGMELDAKGAIPKFEAALEKFPDIADIHFRFGAYLMVQYPDRGIVEIKRAIELDPKHIPALVGLASVYLKNGDLQAAGDYGLKAIAAGPDDFATHVVYGRVLLENDDLARAASELETAVRLAPDSADAHYSLATAYSRLGRREDAWREQEEFKRLRKAMDAGHP